MSPRIGMICPNCGLHHNSPKNHKCKWSDPTSARYAQIRFQLRKQKFMCAICHRPLLGPYNERSRLDDQYIYDGGRCLCVACTDAVRETRAQYST